MKPKEFIEWIEEQADGLLEELKAVEKQENNTFRHTRDYAYMLGQYEALMCVCHMSTCVEVCSLCESGN